MGMKPAKSMAVQRSSVFTGSSKAGTDPYVAEEIWKFPEDCHAPFLSPHSLNLSGIHVRQSAA